MAKQTPAKKSSTISPWIWLAIVVGAVAVIVLILTGMPGAPEQTALAQNVTVDQAVKLRDSGAFILDVRTPEEWNEFHIPDATLIPLDQLPGRVNEVPKDQQVVVVCRSGNRSQGGRDILLQAGYSEVTSMSGGVTEWRALGHPIATGP